MIKWTAGLNWTINTMSTLFLFFQFICLRLCTGSIIWNIGVVFVKLWLKENSGFQNGGNVHSLTISEFWGLSVGESINDGEWSKWHLSPNLQLAPNLHRALGLGIADAVSLCSGWTKRHRVPLLHFVPKEQTLFSAIGLGLRKMNKTLSAKKNDSLTRRCRV